MISNPSKNSPRVLDLFSGAGGFSLGFHLADFEIVGAVEQDKWAAETFSFNHPEVDVAVRDISEMSERDVAKFSGSSAPDILVGGPPCQGFSICRSNAGDPADPRNSLFREFMRFATLLRPEAVLMENVPNLVRARTSDDRPVLRIIESEFERLGYYAYSAVLQATDFGVPQIRRRLFILGTREKLENPFPVPTHYLPDIKGDHLFGTTLSPCPALWDAISDLPELGAGEGEEEMPYPCEPKTGYQQRMRMSSEMLFNHKAMNHTRRMVARFASMAWGESASDVADHLRPQKRNGGGVSGSAYDQNNRRMHPYRPCHTIPASFYANFVHPFQHRNFTAREGARLQSFPDWYVFRGKPTVVSHNLLGREGRHDERFLCQYSQIGNAVPPQLAQAIAEHLRTAIFEKGGRYAHQIQAGQSRVGRQCDTNDRCTSF